MKQSSLTIIFFILIWQSGLVAQSENAGEKPETNLVIKLVTIGPGNDLTSWWGHSAIIVDDLKTGTSKFYNYGLFSFEDDNFITNFIRGRLIFWVGAWNTSNALAYYRGLDRDIRMQVLNLSPQESQEVKDFLENNIKPENARYLYDHYYDNCSTRLRDIIDNITNGQLQKLANQPGRMTLREHTRRHTYHSPVMDFVLMFLMNDTIDKPITVWDDMFLPSEVEVVLDRFTYTTQTGESKKMVKKKLNHYQSKSIAAVPAKAPAHWPYTLAFGIILGCFAIVLVKINKLKWYYIFSAVISFIFGFLGTVLFLMSLFTDHTVTYYNENLFFANPLTFLAFPLVIMLLKNKKKYAEWFYYNLMAITIITVLGLLLKIFPLFDQDNWQAITLILPILLGIFGAAIILKLKE